MTKHTRCTAPDCTKPLFSRGLCTTHYTKARRARLRLLQCTAPGCTQGQFSGGFCQPHYSSRDRMQARLTQLGQPKVRKPKVRSVVVRLSEEDRARLEQQARVEDVLPAQLARKILLRALEG